MTIISLFYNIIKADNLIYNWLQTFNSRIEVSITINILRNAGISTRSLAINPLDTDPK